MVARSGDVGVVRRQLAELAKSLGEEADAAGLGRLATPLTEELARAAPPGARIVVAGAAKRGKSALVNALLAHPGLVPVDVDVATGVHIGLSWGERARATVRLEHGEAAEVPLEAIGRYASEQANPDNVRNVLAVEVELPDPLLERGVELVDTPGVDSVVARHSDVTLAALAFADALVVVVDPSRPLVAPELQFLSAATSRIGEVVFVLTKTDLYPQWRQVRDDDRALIATHAPRFATAPLLAVSSKLKAAGDAALERGRPALADRAHAASGFGELAEELEGIADRLVVVRLGNVVQLALVVVARLMAAVRSAAPGEDGDPASVAAIEEDQARLKALTAAGSRWRQDLVHGIRRLQLDLDAHLAAAGSRLDQEATDSLRSWTPDRADTIGRELDDAVRVLWLDAAALVGHRLAGIAEQLVTTVSEHGVAVALPELSIPELHRAPTRRPEGEDDPSNSGFVGALSTYGGSAGIAFGADRMLALISPLFGPVGLGLGAVVGLAGVVVRRRVMQRVREQRDAQRLAAKTLAEGRAQAAREFTAYLVDVQFALETVVGDLLAERRRDLDEAVREGRAAATRSAEERRTLREQAARRLQSLEKLRTQAVNLHRLVAAARATSAAPAASGTTGA